MMEKLVIGEDSKSEDSEIIWQLKEKFQLMSERMKHSSTNTGQ